MPTESSHGPIQDEKTKRPWENSGKNHGFLNLLCWAKQWEIRHRHFEDFRSTPLFQESPTTFSGADSFCENFGFKTLTFSKSTQDTTKVSTITTLIQASCRQWLRQFWWGVASTTSHSDFSRRAKILRCIFAIWAL